MTREELLLIALDAHAAGCAPIPPAPDGTKRPAVRWQDFIDTPPTVEEIIGFYRQCDTDGIGILCGAASGQLEMLEIEGREAALQHELAATLTTDGHQVLWQRLMGGYVEQSPSGGIHILYRVDGTARGNTKLARNEQREVLIETRGEGGYVVIAPSAGRTHKTGRPYIATAGSLHSIPTISVDDRDALYAAATRLDRAPATPTWQGDTATGTAERVGDGTRPGDDFNRRADWQQILGPHGWTLSKRFTHGLGWTRPGKSPRDGISATTGTSSDGEDRLYVFSSSTLFDTERPYSKFAAHVLLEHGGDYGAAARDLAARGYGTRTDPGPALTLTGTPPPPAGTPAPAVEPAADAETEFWQSRPQLKHCYLFAQARRVSPWAMIGVVLARVITATPETVLLPPLVGSFGSLNMFVALVGRSGAGKGAAESAAQEAVDVGILQVVKTGSGEGMAASYMKRTKQGIEQHTHAVLFSVPEIDTLTALGTRKGSTLMPELRSAYSGERLGFGYVDPNKRLPVPAHHYRLTLICGVQPHRAAALLNESDAGTPQRFLWLPAIDPQAPDTAPEAPARLTWHRPVFGRMKGEACPHGTAMGLCDTARREVDRVRLQNIRGQIEAIDGHSLQTRLKVAAALALLDTRTDISDDDWQLSQIIMTRSDATRASVEQALASTAASSNRGRALADAERAVVLEETLDEHAVKRVAGVVLRKLRKTGDGWVTHSEARKFAASRDRHMFDEAIDRLIDAGQVDTENTDRDDDGHGGDGTKYRLAKAAR